MISAGENKVEALRAILDQGLVTDIVTDVATSRKLLSE